MIKEGRISHMKRLFFASVIVSLLVMGASISWGETTVEGSKSNVNRSTESQGKGAKSTAAPAPHGQQDPCESVKKDPKQYAACQDAAKPAGLKSIKERGRKY
jgi:hypothetical protein